MKYHFILFITLFVNGISFSQQPKAYHPDLESVTISSIHSAIQNHQLTCFNLITAYIDRIKKYNLSVKGQAPINAWSDLNPSVLTQAHQLDTSFKKTGRLSGPLHCIPIILKDNIDSFDTTTTSGSYALLGSQPVRDAFLVRRLRNAGAIILGKGGMDEFAWGMFGISSRSGRIGNAYDPSKNPGGSSGGPAAAVSASFALLGIGTDNSGSVRIPAAFHGLVGLRPSTGLISQQGIFPMGNLDGTAGPIARSTMELAILLDIIAKSDPHDLKTLNIPREETYTKFLNIAGLTNKRIGIVHHVNDINTFDKMPLHIEKIIQNATKDMQKMGATVIDVNLPLFNNNRQNNQAGEIQDVNEYLASFPSTRKNFRDICESNRTRNFGTIKDCLHFIKNVPSKSSKSYQKAQAIFDKNKIYVQKVMEKNNLDALLIPITTQGSATYDGMTVNTWRAPVSSNSGLPSININVGYNAETNLPIGVELVGKQFHEGILIEIAYAYEMQTPKKINPIMPEEDSTLLNLSIPDLNNLFTLLGKNAYEEVLIHNKGSSGIARDLTPERFREITADTIEKFKVNLASTD
ncbi:amidase [Fluoribacter dumoffii]|uniref:Glutamyl-tRNA(Gln) amidotransferase subunit A n=1 Tax=Fluoribacter dumoffii TaxID=463 RepID=A0A377G9E7_9GAMM|nr:amidase [Fluoribacter dumoffii]KTC90316.1 amidase [Fluoribacter dumoffii NY 23]MCW8385634.1 amidase [Fluoribacter dumoffii]MCW8418663.1 amidase [Fluoribacter dumoffii]MCW8453494.1 amidase [Fluoribacter dumoffii]MCW8459287.1 amidase [Fluoribacter dumoffii]